MCTRAFIKRHISSLPKGMIFSTREMLNYGRRSAIDQCLYRMVKSGRIIRLACGLFMTEDANLVLPSTVKVASQKARAFCKRIVNDASEVLGGLGPNTTRKNAPSYAVNGHSSSFRYGEVRIYFRGVCARKMFLGEDPVGLTIKALWQLGKTNCDERTMERATDNFNRPQRKQFRLYCHLMPVWMTNIFKKQRKQYFRTHSPGPI